MQRLAIGKVKITPELPVKLAGFAVERPAVGVHDPLYARLFLFEGEQDILWVMMDLLCADETMLSRIAEKTGIPESQILVSTTHTHSGPMGTMDHTLPSGAGGDAVFGRFNSDYIEQITDAIASKTGELRKEGQPYQMRVLSGTIEGLGTNRHDPSMENDDAVFLMDFRLENGSKTMICRMACHPTVLNGENRQISADFPGTFEKSFPEYEQIGYVNGSCGDTSTRFTRQSNGFDELERFGTLIKDTLTPLLESDRKFEEPDEPFLARKMFILQKKQDISPAEIEQNLKKYREDVETAIRENRPAQEIRLLQSLVEGEILHLDSARVAQNDPHPLSEYSIGVNYLKLGSAELVTTPLEVFCSLGNRISRDTGVTMIGYTNGGYAYLPDLEAYEKGFYESISSFFERGEGEKFVESVELWIQSLQSR